MKNNRECYADYLRIISVIAVILTHITGTVVVNYFNNIKWWWLANMINSLTRWAVPVMLMISGAFVIDSTKRYTSVQFWRKKFTYNIYRKSIER